MKINFIKNFLSELDLYRKWRKYATKIEPLLTKELAKEQQEYQLKILYHKFYELSNKFLSKSRFHLDWNDRHLCVEDQTTQSPFDRHYIYHPAWAARVLTKVKPKKHVDFSSTLIWSAIISAFFPVDFYDYRYAPIVLEGLKSGFQNLTQLTFESNSLESVSCMHVLEHIGLGRYGDPIDPEGDLKAISELIRVTKIGGHILIVVPVGKAKLMFNAHRIYDYSDFCKLFSQNAVLVEFALVPDGEASDGLIYNPVSSIIDQQEYGCGCFWFQKVS
jgi:hypothetical protein